MNRDDSKVASQVGAKVDSGEPCEVSGTEVFDNFLESMSFSRLLLPNMDNYLARIVAPIQEQMASIAASFPEFSMPTLNLPAFDTSAFYPEAQEILKRISEQQAQAVEGFRNALGPLFAPELFHGLNRDLLPPNLKEHAEEIGVTQVREFLEEEGIPLYLVPRGRIALRLIQAQDRSARRRVLGSYYNSIIDDCDAVLENANPAVVGNEMVFVQDGLSAMRAGHFRSAQAMFTVTLDTLITGFHQEKATRRLITNRKKGAAVPDVIEKMGVHQAMVWLPIWNAHEAFWKAKGDEIPRYYSRHASVHGVSSRQFSKRNCIQALMLVTSLIGYANQKTAEFG